jgi:hypothetical protein
MPRDPIVDAGEATRALNVIAAVRRVPSMTAAQIVTYLNSTLMPDDPDDDIEPFSLTYVTTGLAKAGALLTNTAGAYSITDADRYVQRVAADYTAIELAPVGAAFRFGSMW